MDERYSVHARGSVAIGGGSILAIGDIEADYEPKQTIDCAGRVVMPGLINAHTHVAMAMLRGLADDLRLDVWLLGYMMPVERAVRPAGFCRARHEPGLRGDDPVGHDLLRGHVLLRGSRRRDGRRRWSACRCVRKRC